jgi:hypothetical protein
MQNTFSTNHDRFGELSALALVGQVSREEYLELQHHLESCDVCRTEYSDFAHLLLRDLPLLHDQMINPDEGGLFNSPRSRVSVTSARNGHPVAENQQIWGLLTGWMRSPRLNVALCTGLCLALVLLSLTSYRLRVREGRLASTVSSLQDQVTDLQGRLAASRRNDDKSDIAAEVNDLKTRQASELARRATLESRLDASTVALHLLRDELRASQGLEAEASTRANQAQERLAKTSSDLEVMAQERNQAMFALHDKEQELAGLSADVKAAHDSLDRDRELLSHDRDIRDLMGARNLRIIDVYDVDKGPFGRVFFTEGKSLVFYAFDLDRAPSPFKEATFQGWGVHGSSKSARSLGIFYRDDQKDNRWILKYSDPRVLSEIDSVFVTIEPRGGSRKPTGARALLPAYLKTELNHP